MSARMFAVRAHDGRYAHRDAVGIFWPKVPMPQLMIIAVDEKGAGNEFHRFEQEVGQWPSRHRHAVKIVELVAEAVR